MNVKLKEFFSEEEGLLLQSLQYWAEMVFAGTDRVRDFASCQYTNSNAFAWTLKPKEMCF